MVDNAKEKAFFRHVRASEHMEHRASSQGLVNTWTTVPIPAKIEARHNPSTKRRK